MMNWRAIGTASAIAIIATFSTVGITQDLRSQQASIEKDVAALNLQIAAKQQQIAALRSKPSPEQADVVAAQKILDAARAELKTTPGTDNEGKVRNAEFKLKLAQMKFDKANGGIEVLNDEIDKLKQQVIARQQQIKELNIQASGQAQALQQKQTDERLKQQQEQAQELARTKREAESAQKEIERLKAALAAQEAAAAKTAVEKTVAASPATSVAPATLVAPATMAPATIENTPKPAPTKLTPAVQAPAAQTQALATQTEAIKTAAAPSANANGPIKLNSQDQVLHELQTTSQLVAQAHRGEDTASLVLYLKHPGAATTNKDKVSLRALGNNQYRANTKVDAGEYEAVIGFNHWTLEFASSESGETTFLCDYRDKNAPRLVIYQSSLEGSSK